MRRDPDAVLVELVRRSDREALRRFIERCWPVAWKAAYAVMLDRELAEDVAQEAVQRALRGLDTFDESRPLEPWVRRIAVNRAIDELRRDRRLSAAAQATEIRPPWAEDADPRHVAVAEAIAALPLERRTVIVLHYWLDYTAEAIAETLELPLGTVSSRLQRARDQLRELLKEEENAA